MANILPSDADKTKSFADKDFSQAFLKKPLQENKPGMDGVFEPRPPHRVLQSPGLVSKSLSPRGIPGAYQMVGPQYCLDPCEDPWLRQSDVEQANKRLSAGSECRIQSPGGGRTCCHSDKLGGSHGNLAHTLSPPPPPSASMRRYSAPDPNADSNMAAGEPSYPMAVPSGALPPSAQPPHQSLDHALQNLTDLTQHLTRRQDIDPDDIVIDSKALESMLQGAEGYTSSRDRRNLVSTDRLPRETDIDALTEQTPLILQDSATDNHHSNQGVLELESTTRNSDSGDENEEANRDAVFV